MELLEEEEACRTTGEEVNNGRSSKTDTEISSKEVSKKKKSMMPRFGCLRVQAHEKGGVDMKVDIDGERTNPTHLIIMINGIIGSSQNWRYAAKQFLKKYPEDVVVHCSERNSALSTFDGVDVMGDRLAEEIISVIKRHPSVQKISFIGHSLGGLIARYAIARLYECDPAKEIAQQNRDSRDDNSGDLWVRDKFKGKIAGLEPINFITFATPHLGSRGHKQVPVFCGSYTVEKIAAKSSRVLGRTGKHLFLTDKSDGKPPLLLCMATDCEDLKFMSALKSFKRRVAYSNARFDHMVGWSSSSIRRKNELPKVRRNSKGDKYPHIVNVEPAKATVCQEAQMEANINGFKNVEAQEEMIRGLTKVSWERVDVSFSGSIQRIFAHNTILVKTYMINSHGADVVEHMVDNIML